MKRRSAGFTLIELLVVISIITVLVSMLLPALGASRQQAKRIQDSSNIRGQVAAYSMYAIDRQQRLPCAVGLDNPYSNTGADLVMSAPSAAASQSAIANNTVLAGPYFNFGAIFSNYGSMSCTANPCVASPPMNSPLNGGVSTTAVASPSIVIAYQYWPGYQTSNLPASSSKLAAPLRLDIGHSDHIMVQDTLMRRPTNDPPNTWVCIQAKEANPERSDNASVGRPGKAFFISPSPMGAYCGRYDGAVAFKPFAEFTEWQYHSLPTYLYGAQPDRPAGEIWPR